MQCVAGSHFFSYYSSSRQNCKARQLFFFGIQRQGTKQTEDGIKFCGITSKKNNNLALTGGALTPLHALKRRFLLSFFFCLFTHHQSLQNNSHTAWFNYSSNWINKNIGSPQFMALIARLNYNSRSRTPIYSVSGIIEPNDYGHKTQRSESKSSCV